MTDYNISGSGSISGGEYDNIGVSGSCTMSGHVKCKSMCVSGSCRGDGDVVCAQFKGSGSVRAHSITADKIECSGSLSCDELKAQSIGASGSVKTDSIEADRLVCSGDRVFIGEGCEIGRVEYGTSYECAKGSTVGSAEKSE